MTGLILVAGATGRQGGAVARHLLKRGFAGEVRQGKALADAAKAAGVQHFVQSTMADGVRSADQIEHFRSKQEIERHIDALKLPRTFLGTVTFMDNFLDPKFGGAWSFPTMSGVMPSDVPYHLLAVDDLGAAGAEVLANPANYLGKKLNLASETLSVPQLKAVYREVTGRGSKRLRFPAWLLRLINREFAAQLAWQAQGNWRFGTDTLESLTGKHTPFAAFVREHRLRNL